MSNIDAELQGLDIPDDLRESLAQMSPDTRREVINDICRSRAVPSFTLANEAPPQRDGSHDEEAEEGGVGGDGGGTSAHRMEGAELFLHFLSAVARASQEREDGSGGNDERGEHEEDEDDTTNSDDYEDVDDDDDDDDGHGNVVELIDSEDDADEEERLREVQRRRGNNNDASSRRRRQQRGHQQQQQQQRRRDREEHATPPRRNPGFNPQDIIQRMVSEMGPHPLLVQLNEAMAQQALGVTGDVDDMSYEQLLELQERVGFVSKGVKPGVVEERTKLVRATVGDKCTVCQMEYEACDEECRLLPKCSHVFHKDCVDTWFNDNKVCPTCKTEI